MISTTAYLSHSNPFNKDYFKKYNFVFKFVYNESDVNIDRVYHFYIREDENISHLIDKIVSVINTSYRIKLELLNNETADKSGEKDFSKNDNKDQPSLLQKSQIEFYKNNEKIHNKITFKDISSTTDKLEFKILNFKYEILINVPQVLNLELPNTIFAETPLSPSVYDVGLVDTKKSEFFWYKSIDKNSWEQIAKSFSYFPTKNDINYYLKLKCIPKFENKVGAEFEAVSPNVVRNFDLICPYLERQKYTKYNLSGKSFRVISYNILSDRYVNGRYPYCPDYALDIHYRKQLLLKELKKYKGDIICIQETDYTLFKSFLKLQMSKLGYKHYYESKQGRPEGVSTFYRSARFSFINSKRCVLSEEVEKNGRLRKFQQRIKQHKEVYDNLIDQNTVLQILVLKSNNKNNEILVVGNTHLYFHPSARHIRILQSYICMHLLDDTCYQIKQKNLKSRVSVVFCGDFNSQPDSGVFDIITNGMISADHEDWKKNEDEIVTDLSLVLNKKLTSAYGKPEFTNYTEDFKACLDYIFFEEQFLQIKQLVPLLSEDELKKHVALPSIIVPSDHVALIVDFNWK